MIQKTKSVNVMDLNRQKRAPIYEALEKFKKKIDELITNFSPDM